MVVPIVPVARDPCLLNRLNLTHFFPEEGLNKNKGFSENISLSRHLNARARYQNCQVRFFETMVLPENFLEKNLPDEIEKSISKAFSQMRIDFSMRV